jgi:hypothetical protein
LHIDFEPCQLLPTSPNPHIELISTNSPNHTQQQNHPQIHKNILKKPTNHRSTTPSQENHPLFCNSTVQPTTTAAGGGSRAELRPGRMAKPAPRLVFIYQNHEKIENYFYAHKLYVHTN